MLVLIQIVYVLVPGPGWYGLLLSKVWVVWVFVLALNEMAVGLCWGKSITLVLADIDLRGWSGLV